MMTYTRTLSAAVLCAGLALLSVPAQAGVFLNGVNIDGVTNQKFENVTVEIDAKGNILITAKGFDVKAAPPKTKPKAASPGAAPVTKRYFLVSETNAPGMPQYEVDVFINSVWVKRISHKDPQTVIEISKHLKQGPNTMHLTATKVVKGKRTSASPQHYLRVIVGEGNMGGNQVMIDKALLEQKYTAADTDSKSTDHPIQGR
jgi:hypothetical protein